MKQIQYSIDIERVGTVTAGVLALSFHVKPNLMIEISDV